MRTTQAAIIFILAVLTMGLGLWGRMLSRKAEEASREVHVIEDRIERVKVLRTERLALSHRLKLLSGKAAQLEAVGAPETEQGRIAADIANTVNRLAEINAELGPEGTDRSSPVSPAG